MKLTDENMDKLFQESAAKQSFAYKPEYWEEFSTSLTASAPLSEVSDEALDTAFQENASQQSFEYKPEYWEAFSAALSENAPLSQVSDGAFDAAFQDKAAAISVDYKPEFWSEFSHSLPLVTALEDVSDAEVDAMYRAEAANLAFEYKPTYWEEMATALRKRRRRPEFLWFGLSGIFATAIIAMLFIDQSPLKLDWDTPEFSLDGVSPNSTKTQNGNLASNDFVTNTTANQFNTSNQGIVSVDNSAALNSADGTGTTVTVANGNEAQNGIVNPNVNTTNLVVVTNEPNLGTQEEPNNNQASRRFERITPALTLTALPSVQEQRTGSTDERTILKETDALAAIALRPVEQTFNNELVATNLPPLPKYKGGIQSRMYVQALGGISESAVIPSEVMSSSYGLGIGWEFSKRNWTAGIGSNLIIENYGDLFLSRFGKEYDAGSFSKRQDIRYQNLFSAELNLSIGRAFGRHQLQLGIRPSYTFGSRMTQTITSSVSAFGETTQSSETTSGLNAEMLGIQRWGMKPTFGYAYHFSSNWTLGVNIGVELLQSIDESFITGINNTLPIDGQLYLRKTLNFRK